MTTRLIIARHGNTFAPGDVPTRVGRRTDLPLVASGEAQARRIGEFLRLNHMVPGVVFAAPLKRSLDTARLAVEALGRNLPVISDDRFNEIDYGPDENQPESVVMARIGEQALLDWDEQAKVPPGWQADPQAIVRDWLDFGDSCQRSFRDQTILVVTSSGIARFAPHLTGDFEGFRARHGIKIATGSLCFLRLDGSRWIIERWNVRPPQ